MVIPRHLFVRESIDIFIGDIGNQQLLNRHKIGLQHKKLTNKTSLYETKKSQYLSRIGCYSQGEVEY